MEWSIFGSPHHLLCPMRWAQLHSRLGDLGCLALSYTVTRVGQNENILRRSPPPVAAVWIQKGSLFVLGSCLDNDKRSKKHEEKWRRQRVIGKQRIPNQSELLLYAARGQDFCLIQHLHIHALTQTNAHIENILISDYFSPILLFPGNRPMN